MGLFARRFGGDRSEVRTAPEWAADEAGFYPARATDSGVRVTEHGALQLSAVLACVRLLAGAIASLPAEIVVSIGGRRFTEFGRPSWLTAPDPDDPTITTGEHLSQVAMSLLTNGSAFVYVDGGVADPQRLLVLDPARVEIKTNPLHYIVTDTAGRIVADVAPEAMLQGSWLRLPGHARGISPIETARAGIGLGLAAEAFGARFFGHGSTLSFGIEVPGSLTEEQRETLRKSLRDAYEGVQRSHNVGLLTGGAKFVSGLAPTPEQAQFLETRQFTIEEICRLYGVPPSLIASTKPGSMSYASTEQQALAFRQYAVLPLARRIEDMYGRLVGVPEAITTAGASATFRLNIDGLARGDMATRYDSYQKGVMGGFMTPNEARALEDLPPLPGGDQLYMQQQMVPLSAALPA